MNKKNEKNKSLEIALLQIEKQFGKGSIMKLGDDYFLNNENSISTGSLSLDIALGIGGLPLGRIVEIFGPESSGKTTLTLQIIAEAQKKDKICAFIDAEHAIDPIYAEKIGVNIKDLLFSQPDSGEQALQICSTLAKNKAVDIIVVDSVAALTPQAEIDGDIGDVHVGLLGRLMSQAMRKLVSDIKNANILLIFVNQIRNKIGVIFGSNEITPGGNALKFYSSIRLDIRKITIIKENDKIIGNEIRVKVIKNKLAPPFKQAEFQIIYGKGINKYGEILDIALKLNLITKLGSWYNYNEIKLGQGKLNAIKYIESNIPIFKEIELKIKNNLFNIN